TTTVSRLIGDPGLVLVMYRVEVTLPDPVTTSPDHDAHAWVSLAQVHERLDPSVAAVVARCRYGLDG
nr:hypothetical protein [Deltaproteobacteria bacterium]